MKRHILTIVLGLILPLVLFGCRIDVLDTDHYSDWSAPRTPRGVTAINGDGMVEIYWSHNYENDLSGYNIYVASSYDGVYQLIGSTNGNYFYDYEVRNGFTYYYAVSAYDYDGNESEMSYEEVVVTPRPEGFNSTVFDYIRYPERGGFSFNFYGFTAYDDLAADFFFENYNGTFYINVWDDTDIQDMGPTYDIYDIPYAPETGWNPNKYVEAIPGHTYVIWTWDNHFAKIRIKNITPDRVVFDWAFQLVEGNYILKPDTGGKREVKMEVPVK